MVEVSRQLLSNIFKFSAIDVKKKKTNFASKARTICHKLLLFETQTHNIECPF